MPTVLLERQPKLGLRAAGTLMSPAEYDAVERWDDRYRYELIHGVLVVTALPSPSETGPNEALGFMLAAYKVEHPGVLDATLPEQIVRTPQSRRRADRLIWVGLGRMPNVKGDVPAIAVEFVSTSKRDRRRDYEEKRREYLGLGIREYWIIDRFRRIMTVLRAGRKDKVIRETQRYATRLLPGFKLPLAELLATADAWAQSQSG